MRVDWPLGTVVAVNVLGWPVLQMGLGWLFTQMPARWFDPRGGWAWEGHGRIYERWVKIKSWKSRLPDAAPWFSGGFAKKSFAGSDPHYRERFARETRRGELCHWTAIAFTPVFFLWNPWWGDLIMAVYAMTANFPCILVQRYNRFRLVRVNTLSDAFTR